MKIFTLIYLHALSMGMHQPVRPRPGAMVAEALPQSLFAITGLRAGTK